MVRTITALIIMQFCYTSSPSLSLLNALFVTSQSIFLLKARDQFSDSQILMHVRTRYTLYRNFFKAEMSTIEWVRGIIAVRRATMMSSALRRAVPDCRAGGVTSRHAAL
jgi:hypothetical protein